MEGIAKASRLWPNRDPRIKRGNHQTELEGKANYLDNALYRNAKTGGQEISNNKKPRSMSGVFRVGCLAV
ncbi:hypothetical protein, partial [Aeromonas salmonicida]